MLCRRCGQIVPDGAVPCPVCGQQPTSASGPGPPATASAGAPLSPQASGKAIASLILGLFFFIFFAAIPAIVFGHLALSDIKASAGRLRGRGLAIAGLALGYFGIAMVPIIFIIAIFALPKLLRPNMAQNERTAVNSVRYLDQAERSYAVLYPKKGFACDFQSMIDAGVLDAKTVRTASFGYAFGVQKCGPGSKRGPNTKYQVVAYPVQKNTTGMRMFCSDESGVIKSELSQSSDECLAKGTKLE